MSQLELAFKITADVSNAQNGVVTLTGNLNQLSGASQTLSAAAGKVSAGLLQTGNNAGKASGNYTKAAQGVRSISEQMERLQGIGMAWLGGSQLISGMGKLVALADEYGQMASRIKMATESATEYEMVQARLIATADKTFRPLKEAQEMYIRTADSLKSLGYNTEQTLDVTDSFSYLLVKNAASGERAEAALSAFSTSLVTGSVHAMQWRTILAAVPSIVGDITKSTGKTTEEIRRMGATGKLAVTDLTEALRKSLKPNMKDAEDMPVTVTDAFTRLRNAIQVYVGELNESIPATALFTMAADKLKENLDIIAKLLTGTVAGALVVAIAKTALLTAAHVQASLSATLLALEERKAAAAALAEAEAEAAAAQTSLAHERAAMGLGTAVVGLAAAEERAAVAANVLAAAQVRVSKTASAVAAVRAGVLRFLSGWVGFAMTVGAVALSFVDFGNKTEVAASSLSHLTGNLEEAKKAFLALNEAQQQAELARLNGEMETLAKGTKATRKEIDDLMDGMSGMFKRPAEEVRHTLAIIKSALANAAQGYEVDWNRVSRAISECTGLTGEQKDKFMLLVGQMDEAQRKGQDMTNMIKVLSNEMKANNRVTSDANLHRQKTRDELQKEIQGYNELAKSIKALRAEKEKEAESYTKDAEKKRESGRDKLESAKEKAANMRMSGMSEEDRQAQAGREAQFAKSKADLAMLEALQKKEAGDLAGFEKALDEAEKLYDKAQRFAEQSGNDRLVESIGKKQKDVADQQAEGFDAKAGTAMEEAQKLSDKLKEVAELAKQLKEEPVSVELDAEGAQSGLESLNDEIAKLPDEKTIRINIETNGSLPDISGAGNSGGSGGSSSNLPGRASGGLLPGFSPHDRADNILFRGTAGEYVVRRAVTKQKGAVGFLARFNKLGMAALAGLANLSSVSSQKNAALSPSLSPALAQALAAVSAKPASVSSSVAAPSFMDALTKDTKRFDIPAPHFPSIFDRLPAFADGGLLGANGRESNSMAPVVFNLPGMGEYPAQMAVNVRQELERAFAREALKRGKR